MRLIYEKGAVKSLARMQPKVAASIRESLQAIAAARFARHANVKALAGALDGFRLRRGDWRVGYYVNREADEMVVVWVEPRGGAYR